ncbi:MAG: hypothetical protein IJR45_04000, partial [Firmicutes bacterium]|nr:hypothetical protein [Bacillota bacterium]
MLISEQIKPKKKRTVLKVFLGLVLVLGAAVAVVAAWQRENIKAVIDSKSYSQEELADKITESKQKVQQSLEVYDLPVMRDFTFEEEEMIRKGEITVDEAMQNIMVETAEKTADNVSENTAGSGESSSSQTQISEQKTASTILSGYVTQLYEMKAYYLSQLGGLETEMRAVYVNSGRDKTKIPSIISSYMPRAASMESECDGRVNALISELRSELSSIGADTSIADEIYDAYINEKALKKAYYLSLY